MRQVLALIGGLGAASALREIFTGCTTLTAILDRLLSAGGDGQTVIVILMATLIYAVYEVWRAAVTAMSNLKRPGAVRQPTPDLTQTGKAQKDAS